MFDKSIVIPSVLDSVNQVERVIDEISEVHQISSEVYGKILIAAIEAVNNAITHGNKFDESKTVTVHFKLLKNTLNISVHDQGNGFNPTVIPDPTSPENIENISGRGVFIMNQYSDTIEFSDNGRCVTMTFHVL